MDLLLLAKPGVHLYSVLHNSDTAWHAIRFYEHINLGYGVLFFVSGCSPALAFASDIRYYIRRYTAYHLFRAEQNKQIYVTPALINSRYFNHTDSFSDAWNYRLILIVTDSKEHPFICTRVDAKEGKADHEEEVHIQVEYEILCTKEEWEESIITKR